MPTLGDHFSEEKKRENIKSNFICGNIYYLYCSFTTPNKDKYLLLVCTNPKPIFFVINSSINQFILKKKNLYECQVCIDVRHHQFLDYDSYANCTEPILIEYSEIENQLLSDMSKFKGKIIPEVQRKVICAVHKSRTINRRDKELIMTSLTNPS
jgi:hypothetical protein